LEVLMMNVSHPFTLVLRIIFKFTL